MAIEEARGEVSAGYFGGLARAMNRLPKDSDKYNTFEQKIADFRAEHARNNPALPSHAQRPLKKRRCARRATSPSTDSEHSDKDLVANDEEIDGTPGPDSKSPGNLSPTPLDLAQAIDDGTNDNTSSYRHRQRRLMPFGHLLDTAALTIEWPEYVPNSLYVSADSCNDQTINLPILIRREGGTFKLLTT